MAAPSLTEEQVKEIVETPVTGGHGRTPREEIIREKPNNNGREKEVIILWDLSGSNMERVGPGSDLTKRDLVQLTGPLIVRRLAGDDSQAVHEVGTDKGGCRSFGFSDDVEFLGWNPEEEEFEDDRDFGDANEANIQEILENAPWGGMTYIMPAIRAAEKAFQAEFGDRPLRNRPTMEIVIMTDGALNDQEEFERWLEQADETCVVGVAAYGSGRGHQLAVNEYREIVEKNRDDNRNRTGNPNAQGFISLVNLNEVDDPEEVATDVQLMAS